MRAKPVVVIVTAILLFPFAGAAENWPQFRDAVAFAACRNERGAHVV